MKYSEKWGDSIESAVQFALQDLKLSREQVKVTVLEEPSKGFLGIGAKLAKVRVEEIVQEKVKPAEKKEAKAKPVKEEKAMQPVETKAETAEAKPENTEKKKQNKKKKSVKKFDASEIENIELVSKRPDNLTEAEEHPAKAFLKQVAEDMGIEVSIKAFVNADSVYIDIEGKDTGTVIGKRGATLDSIQYLTSLVVNKDESNYIRVVVDAEGYRAKREVTLEKLAIRLAEKAVKSGKNVRLEPMNPYERKVIHTTLQGVPSVTTKSEGDEPFRRVVILPVRN